jgi:hypothetical protein
MGLRSRDVRRHETVGVQKTAVDSSAYWDYHPNQRVMTVDGVPGRVTAVQDGPYPGTEAYLVELDRGLGGGEYRTGELRALHTVTSSEHLASEDYPELGDILLRRPDIARG